MKTQWIIISSMLVIMLLAGCVNPPQMNSGKPVVEETMLPQVGQTTTEPPADQPPEQPLEQPTQDSAEPLPPDNEPVEDRSNEFMAKLAAAIERKDFELLSAMIMDGDFAVAYWRSEGLVISADEAVRHMREIYLVEGSQPATRRVVDLRGLLEGADPLQMFGPNAQLVEAFHVSGLGPRAEDEAIMVISRDPATGQNTWYGMLAAAGGFNTHSAPADPATPPADDAAFGQQLAQAFEARDFDTLRSLMRDRFSFATFNNQLIEVPSDEAMQTLRETSLVDGSQPAARFGTDIPAMLGGSDPLGLWGPVASPVRAIHVMGLGPNAAEEAVLVIGRDPNSGQFYWRGILLPQFGYFRATDTDERVLPTDVKFVLAKEDVNLRSGPGQNFAVEGQVFAGQIVQVTGKSIDEAWWRVMCEQDSSGMCWVSADPTLTEPTTAP